MKLLTALLIWMMAVMPSAGPLMPSSMVETLHVMNEAHHIGDGHDHSHDHADEASDNHIPRYDALVYYEDYLHVEFKNPPQHVITQAVSQPLTHIALIPAFVASAWPVTIPSRPPAWSASRTPFLPVYLSTQRIRV